MPAQPSKPSRAVKAAESFLAYCKANPDQRFWQALRNWSKFNFVGVSINPGGPYADTYYFED